MNSRRLLIAAEIFPPAIGGPATYAATLARELPPRGWHVTVLCYGDTVAGEYPRQTKVIAVPRRGGPAVRYGRYFLTLWRLAKAYPVVYAQGPVSSGLPALLVAILRRKKLAVKVTGDYAWEQAFHARATRAFIEEFQRHRAWGKFWLLRWIERRVCRRADLVVAPSSFLQQIVVGWGVPAAKVTVVHNAVTLPAMAADRATLRQRWQVPANAFLILTVGRPVPWKGYGKLAAVMVSLMRQHPAMDARWAIIGITGDELEAFATAAGVWDEVKNITPSITPLGAMDRREVSEWIAMAEILVLNTAYEGMSHVIIEAMARGVPVVTTPVGGNREIITPGANGVFVDYDNTDQLLNAIIDLYRHPERRRQLAAAARQIAPQFSLERMLAHTEVPLIRLCAS